MKRVEMVSIWFSPPPNVVPVVMLDLERSDRILTPKEFAMVEHGLALMREQLDIEDEVQAARGKL